jgi:signal transduction histidine kinase/CheY-like chemotaxis protein
MSQDRDHGASQAAADVEALRQRIAELEARLAEHGRREAMMRLMVDNVPDLIWAKDLERRYLFVNKAICEKLLHARDTDEPIGKTDLFFAERERGSRPDDSSYHTFGEICADSDAAVMESKRAQRFDEYGNVRGRHLHLDVYKAPFWNDRRELIGTVGCARDVTQEMRLETERVQAETEHQRLLERMREAQRLESLGVLAGGIAHDFNNILMAILGNAELAQIGLPADSPATDSLKEIEKASARAAELCRQMLAYAGKERLVMERVDLSSIAARTAKLLKASLPKKITLDFTLTEDLPRIEADISQIQQVVVNLVTNAAEAIGSGVGAISVRTGAIRCDEECLGKGVVHDGLAAGSYVFVEVADDGPGFDEATQAKLFDPFFTTKFTGRGLGLPAVLGIVRSHGGTILVDSEVGRGSRLQVLLPALGAAEPGSEASEQRKPPASRTVLFVDDEAPVRKVGGDMLRFLGYEVISASSCEDAERQLEGERERIACVLLDLTMPEKNGEECLQGLQALCPGVRVVIVSGHDERQVAERLAGRGVTGFLQKPFNLARLRETLQQALEG